MSREDGQSAENSVDFEHIRSSRFADAVSRDEQYVTSRSDPRPFSNFLIHVFRHLFERLERRSQQSNDAIPG
jgi:hypothetical protein